MSNTFEDASELASKKRKREADDSGASTREGDESEVTSEEIAAPTNEVTPKRFQIGDQVLCNLSKRNGFLWKRGKVESLSEKLESGETIPYVVRLDDGKLAGSPQDHDECIRLAARACMDTRVMRAFAVSEKERDSVKLRFSEGDRVAVQLDTANWEEGVVIEVWAAPERNGKVFKTWAGVAVPYVVDLDIKEYVMVPFDSDEVIRPESAIRPAQRSVAEQIGGTERKTIQDSAEKRFVKRRNAEQRWVLVDNKTGFERPCDPPDDDDDM